MKLIPEWYNHDRCLIAWPCNLELYKSQIHSARKEIANLANQIAEEEPVYIYCNSQDLKDCRLTVSNQEISIIEVELDDSWMRDVAPIFYKDDNELRSMNFNFNGYGKYPNFKKDNLVSDFICDQFKIPFTKSSITLEGGGITYDDQGNLFTTESVLLNSNRNNLSKQFLEKELKNHFSLKNIIWFGLILIAAGATYGMMSTRLQAVESKQMQLEKIILSDIPEIKERVIRLEVLLERALAE